MRSRNDDDATRAQTKTEGASADVKARTDGFGSASEGRRFVRLAERRLGVRFTEGNRLELVFDGAVFDVMEQMIGRARSAVHLVMYIWRDGEASERVVRALLDRARAGVRCRILVDPVGTRIGFHRVKHRLEDGGCEVRPLIREHPSPAEPFARTHRKILVCDGAEALAGGWCIWDRFLGDGRHRDQWRDTNVRAVGPVVGEMGRVFDRQWCASGGEGGPVVGDPAPCANASDGSSAAFVASSGTGRPTNAQSLLELSIDAARTRLWWSVGYFVPDPDITARLARRVREGVDVRILVPGPVHDLPLVRAAQRASYPALLRSGVALYEYQPAMMHAKTLVVDDRVGVVGSINAEPFSERVLAEDALVFADRSLTRRLAHAMADDLTRSKRIERAPGRLRCWLGALVARLMLGAARALHGIRLRWRHAGSKPRRPARRWWTWR